MPPKVKYTKEQIINEAFELVRESGIDALSARELAKKLGSSTRPIFSHFSTMDELVNEVEGRGKAVYDEYIEAGFKSEQPFKGYGLQIIAFAVKEPMLFRMLFAGNKGKESFSNFLGREGHMKEVVDYIIWTFGISDKDAQWMFENLIFYAHGIASMMMVGACDFSEEELDAMLGDMARKLVTGIKAWGDENYHFLNPERRK